MKSFSTIVAVPACFALVACTGSTDPMTATVFDNINNINSGEYNRQISDREAQAQAIIDANNASSGRISNMRTQSAQNASTIAALRSDIAAARAEIASARQRTAGNAGAAAQLQQLETQVNAVQRDANSGGDPGVARSELARIRSAVRALS